MSSTPTVDLATYKNLIRVFVQFFPWGKIFLHVFSMGPLPPPSVYPSKWVLVQCHPQNSPAWKNPSLEFTGPTGMRETYRKQKRGAKKRSPKTECRNAIWCYMSIYIYIFLFIYIYIHVSLSLSWIPWFLDSQGLFILASWMIWVAIPSKSLRKFPGHQYWCRWILVQFHMGWSLSKDERKNVPVSTSTFFPMQILYYPHSWNLIYKVLFWEDGLTSQKSPFRLGTLWI